ncbi:aminopeptidase N [Sphaerisporangium sp. NPDC049002]|uniref:aminopeptidase N n=1 Tax=Sphaerisporangium sp. NPDC049002 TaxID=3155392 RepID=UPI003409CA02
MLQSLSYQVHLDLSQVDAPTFRSRTRILFTCARPGASSWVDALPRRVRSVMLNGRPLEYGSDTGRIHLPELAAVNELTVDGDYDFSTCGQGLHRFVDPADQEVYVYSHLQADHAPRVFACFDQPDLKATFEISVRVPAAWTVLSNGRLDRRHRSGPDVLTEVHRFTPTPPISTYLVAVAAGPWASWTAGGPASVPLGVHSRRSLAGHVDSPVLFEQLGAGIEFFAKAFASPYPFAKLDLCFVPEFNFGAMENAGCVLAAETFVFDRAVTRHAHRRRREMIFHELAHQWFGNLVTFRWWDDLWLNEAFATWAGIHAQTQITEYAEAWADFTAGKKAMAYAQDQSPSTHPVVADIPDLSAVATAFDALTYHKGASVLRQLVAHLGLDGFLAGMRRYFATYSYGTAGHTEMISVLQEAAGDDLTAWSRSWLHSAGLTEIRADFSLDHTGRFTRFDLLQEPAGSLRPHRLAVGVYAEDRCGALVRVARHEVDVEGARTSVEALIGHRPGLLVLPNDGDMTYCRIVLDARSADEIIHRIGHLSDPMARSLCWTAAWEMVRHRELPPRRFLTMVICGLQAETQIGVVQRLLRQAATLLGAYTEQGWARARGWPALVDHLLDLATRQDTGADHRLVSVRAVADAALTSAQLDVVRDWFHRAVLAGRPVDEDLRWRLARALVAHGDAVDPIIDGMTGAGERRVERIKASVPAVDAKQWAWNAILGSGRPAQIGALASGFVHPAQHHLIASFAERYVRDIPPLLVGSGDAEPARAAATLMFPTWSVSGRTLAEVDRMLGDGRSPLLRRLVGQARDELALSVGLAARDAAGGAAEPVVQVGGGE